MDSLVELDVEAFLGSWHTHAGVELLAHVFQHCEGLLQAFGVACHAHVVPHDVVELLVDGVNAHQLRLVGLLVLDVHDAVYLGLHVLLSLHELRSVGAWLLHLNLVGEIVLHGVRNDEVTV